MLQSLNKALWCTQQARGTVLRATRNETKDTTMTTIEIKQAYANRREVKGWMKVTGATKEQKDAICCVANTREMNGHLLFAEKDAAAVRARLGI
jgi:hypothetical protein